MTESKNILITGASTGIGYEAARAFLKRGYTVYGSVRTQVDADRLSSELSSAFKPLIFDVTDDTAIDRAAQKLEAELGDSGLACLVNNAGVAIAGPILHVPMERIRHQFAVNVVGLIKVTQAFAPLLGARKNHRSQPGKILNISSISGKMGMPFIGAYVSSKHALEGLSESMRRELQLYGIDVIVIGPGPVKTPIWGKSDEKEMAPYLETDFGPALLKFQNEFVKKAVQEGFTGEYLGEKIFEIFATKNPKARYSLVPHSFKNAFLPSLLPARLLDKLVGKALGLLPKSKIV